MFTINVKGKLDPNSKGLVKLQMIFFKTGFNRVPKQMSITGEFRYWNPDTQRFDFKRGSYPDKNKAIAAEIEKYQSVADAWEAEGKNWTPAELSHYFDVQRKRNIEIGKKAYNVEKFIEMIIAENQNRKRIKNGEIMSSSNNARNYQFLLNVLREYTLKCYDTKFQFFFFENIDEKFVVGFAEYLKERKAENNNVGAVRHRLVGLRAVLNKANKMGVEGVDMCVFTKVSELMTYKGCDPRTIHVDFVRRVEKMDRSWMSEKESFWLDLFLFSYYTGGMPPIDVCYLKKDSIKDDVIIYERIKCNRFAKPLLPKKAKNIIEKYSHLTYGDYALPIFTHKHITEKQKRSRLERLCSKVNRTLEDVVWHLKLKERITWYFARGTFITHMINSGYNPMIVAEQAGNSVEVIQRHYFSITEKGEELKRLNDII